MSTMTGSYYSEDEDGFPSPSPSQDNSQYSKERKKKKRNRSTVVKKNKKKSVTTTDTNNFLKDINNILEDKDASVLQNPKSSRMTLSINRNVNQANIINHTANTSANNPSRGTMRHTIINSNQQTANAPSFAHHQPSKNAPSTIQETSTSRSRNLSDEDSDDDEFDDSAPSSQAIAMRDKFRQERLAKDQAQTQQQDGKDSTTAPDALADRRSTARARLRTTVLNIKSSRPTVMGHPNSSSQPPHNPSSSSIKRNSVAPAPVANSNSYNANKRFSVAQQLPNGRMSVRQGGGRSGSVMPVKGKDSTRRPSSTVDNRLQVSDVYSSSSSDNDSDYYDSSSDSDTDSDDDDDDDSDSESDSDDFDVGVDDESLEEESIVSVIDPKVEESKADPLVYDMLMLGDGGVGKTALLNKFISDSFTPQYTTTRGINQHHSTLYMGEKKMLDRGKLKKRHVHVKLNVWDIGSRLTKHAYIKNSYILNSIIVFVVYDVTSLDSYMSAIEIIHHVRRIKYDQMIVLVGNKADNSTIAADDDDFDSDEDEDNIVVVQQPPTLGLRRLSMMAGPRRASIVDRSRVQPAYDNGIVLREIAKREAALEALRLGCLFFETSAKTGHNVYILFNEVAKILVHKRRKLLFKIEAGIKKMQEENDEHSSDFESSDSSDSEDDDDLSDLEESKSLDVENEEERAQRLQERKERRKELRKQKKKEEEENSDDDDSVLSAMSDWSDEDDDSDDDYVDVYGWGGKPKAEKAEKAECTIM